MKNFILLLLLSLSITAAGNACASDTLPKPGKFDDEEIFTTQRLGTKYDRIVVQNFSTEGAEITNIDEGERKSLEADKMLVVNALTESTVKHLKKGAKFKEVLGKGKPGKKAVILRGKFVRFNGGVGAAKWFLGFMAPKSTKTNITIEAELVDSATNTVLARLKDIRSGAEGNTLGSGNMTKAFIVQAQDEGEELAAFIEDLY